MITASAKSKVWNSTVKTLGSRVWIPLGEISTMVKVKNILNRGTAFTVYLTSNCTWWLNSLALIYKQTNKQTKTKTKKNLLYRFLPSFTILTSLFSSRPILRLQNKQFPSLAKVCTDDSSTIVYFIAVSFLKSCCLSYLCHFVLQMYNQT
jgi:hypothetical protein